MIIVQVYFKDCPPFYKPHHHNLLEINSSFYHDNFIQTVQSFLDFNPNAKNIKGIPIKIGRKSFLKAKQIKNGPLKKPIQFAVLGMSESKKLLTILSILKENQHLNKILEKLVKLQNIYKDFTSPEFLNSEHHVNLIQEVQALKLPELKIIEDIKVPASIVALPLARTEYYTVFFVLVPEGHKFDWHSHPKMMGISKCVFGELKVSTLNKKLMKLEKPSRFTYPKSQLKTDYLQPEGKSASTIDPEAFNIHRIMGTKFSAFIDFLMPDYPQDYCDFYLSRKQDQDIIQFKQIPESKDTIQIWDLYYERVLRSENPIVRNVILK